MVANKKSVIGRQDTVVENLKGRLQLRRPSGQADQRPFLRVFDQGSFAILEGQSNQGFGGSRQRRPTRGKPGAVPEKPATRDGENGLCFEVHGEQPLKITTPKKSTCPLGSIP